MKRNLFSRIVAGIGAVALVAGMMPAMTAQAAIGDLTAYNVDAETAAKVNVTFTPATAANYNNTADDLVFTVEKGASGKWTVRNEDLNGKATVKVINDNTDATNTTVTLSASDVKFNIIEGVPTATISKDAFATLAVGKGELSLAIADSAIKSVCEIKDDATITTTAFDPSAAKVGKDDKKYVKDDVAEGDDYQFIVTTTDVIDENCYVLYQVDGESSTKQTEKAKKVGNDWVFTITEVTGDITLKELVGAGAGADITVKTGTASGDFSAKINGTDAKHDANGKSAAVSVVAKKDVTIEAAATKKSNGAEFIRWEFSGAGANDLSQNIDKTSNPLTFKMPDADLDAEAVYGFKVTLPKEQPVKYYENYGADGQKEISEFMGLDRNNYNYGPGGAALNNTITAVPDAEYGLAPAAGGMVNFTDSDGGTVTPTTGAPAEGTAPTTIVFNGGVFSGVKTLTAINILEGPHKVTFDAPEGVSFTNQNKSATYTKEFTVRRTDADGKVFAFRVEIDESKVEKTDDFKVTYTANGKTVTMVPVKNANNAAVDGSYVIDDLDEVDPNLEGITIKVEGLKSLEEQKEEHPFEDMTDPKSPYYAAIKWAKEKGISAGIEGGKKFGVGQTLTRAEAVTFLYAYAEKPTGASDSPFTDLDGFGWAKDAINWAAKEGVTSGTSATTFEPALNVTRGMAMAYTYKVFKGTEGSKSSFTDVPEGSMFYNQVSWAVENKITAGVGDNQFGVNTPATREAFVTWLYIASGAKAEAEAATDESKTDESKADESKTEETKEAESTESETTTP